MNHMNKLLNFSQTISSEVHNSKKPINIFMDYYNKEKNKSHFNRSSKSSRIIQKNKYKHEKGKLL